jgi:hypothetical protein
LNTPTHTPSLAIATAFAIAGLALPATSPAAEPKNTVPFIAAPSTEPAAGEPNMTPFAAAISARSTGAVQPTLSQPTLVERIIAQERGRHGDPLIVGPSEPASIQILQAPGGFDWGDAGIGGAATFALVLLTAGAAALRHESRRQRAHG